MAKTLAGDDGFHFEADHYFVSESGEYVWIPEMVPRAHQWCLRMTECALVDGTRSVVVSNTFTTEKELKPYLALAEKHGYSVTSIIVENRHGNKSVHDVSDETVEKMRNRFSIKL